MFCPFPNPSLDPAQRVDPYRFVHKAIRTMLASLVETAGRTDFADDTAFDRLRRDTVDAVHVLHAHARVEVQFLDSLLGAYAPSEAIGIQREHAELDAELVGVLEQIDLAVAEGTTRAVRAHGHDFYLRLSRFVAHYFLHMADEELRILPLLHRNVDEIVLRRAIVAAQSTFLPAERAKLYVLVLDAVTRHERDLLLASRSIGDRRKAIDPRAVVRSGLFESRAVRQEEAAFDASDEARALHRS